MTRKKRLLSLLLALVMVLGMLPAAALAAGEVTIISKASDLAALGGQNLTGDYQLGADIDMSGVSMSPINKFSSGTFDGAGHTISNLSMNVTWGNGGLFGELGSSATVKNLTLSNANISSTVGSSSYGTGGLVGKISGTATIEGCGISGTVSCEPSNSYYASYVGGLVGYLNGSCTISNCYSQTAVVNTAKATSSVTGGFLGKTSNYYTLSVTNCYAAGDVTSAVNYAGGFTGYVYCSSNYKHTYENCYSAGTTQITGSGTPYGFAYSYATAGYTFTNCFYDSEKNPKGFNQSGDAIPVDKTTTELKALADTLGSGFQEDSGNINGGYPILAWQFVPDPESVWTVKLTVSPAEATLTWNSEAQPAAADGIYTFENIKYETACSWSAAYEDGDYALQSGTITVKKNVEQAITLEPNLHDLTFTLTPADADLVVKKDDEALTPTSGTTYSVPMGAYTYTASAFGYQDAAGTVTVEKSNKTQDITLTAHPAVTVNFAYGELPAGGGAVENASLVVKPGEREMEATDGMRFTLPVGYAYKYTFKSANYAKVTGEIDLTGVTEVGTQEITIPLTVKTAWGGADDVLQPGGTGTEDDPYRISTGAELAWLAQQVNSSSSGNFNAILVKDIDLGDENWTPIGKDNSYSYKGIFDGQGHTVEGLKITTTDDSTNQGLFGYVNGGTVKNVTVEGEISGGGTFQTYGVGGITGVFDGSNGGLIENCVSKVNISCNQNVGGIAGLIKGGGAKTICSCVNYGTIQAAGSNAGGIVGNFYYKCTVEDCYNRGNVSADFNAGGIAGLLNDGGAAVKRSYSTVAPAIGKKSSGTVDAASVLYIGSGDDLCTSITDADLKAVPDALGSAFMADVAGNINGGYPILEFQVTKYDVTFTVSPADAVVTIAGAVGTQEGSTWTFRLPDGTYPYTVSRFGYAEETGRIAINGGNVSKEVLLSRLESKEVTFQVTSPGAEPTVTVTWNGETVEPTDGKTYELPYGEYSYTGVSPVCALCEADSPDD